MTLALYDRVRETSTVISTNDAVLLGAVTGFQSFAVVGNGNTCYYTIVNNAAWEVGIGTYTSSTNTLSRDTVLSSSNAGSAVSFTAGAKDVFVTQPSERAVYVDAANTTVTIPGLNNTGNTTLGDASTDTATINAAATFNANAVISVTDNTNAALRITQLGLGNALLVEDSANPDSTPFVIDANGKVIVGTTTLLSTSNNLKSPTLKSSSGIM